MTRGSREPGRLLSLAAILAPLGAVIVARALVGGGPAQAPAAELELPTLPTVGLVSAPATPSLTPEQVAAAEYLSSAQLSGHGSPMAKPVAPKIEPVVEVRVTPPTPKVDPTDDLGLSSVMGKGQRAVALISGRIYRIGDEVREGWTLTAVDVQSRTATLTHGDGRTCVLGLVIDD